MQQVIYEKSEGMNVPIKIWTKDFEDGALGQAKNISRLPFIHKWVSLMPDTHFGYGCPIGSVVPCDGYILPYCVGSDIGCGMSAIPLGVNTDDLSESDVVDLFSEIQQRIPVGQADHGDYYHNNLTVSRTKRLCETTEIVNSFMDTNNGEKIFKSISGHAPENIYNQLGTLGSGNHFCELQKDSNGMLWFMVHSGSRNLGAKVCDFHMKKAEEMCKKYHSPLSGPYLAYLPVDSQEGKNYIEHMNLALYYAYLNRENMILACLTAFSETFGIETWDMDALINIHHNYADIENHFGKNVWVHRKGATAARKGQLGIIPGSMCTKSYIVRGKGDKDSFMSCSHGSGRNFSRTESKKRIDSGVDPSVEDQMGNVLLFGSNDVRDEVGSSYKSIEDVMGYQTDLVDIVTELTPIAVLKG